METQSEPVAAASLALQLPRVESMAVESDELSDEALEHVVGGLARVWYDVAPALVRFGAPVLGAELTA